MFTTLVAILCHLSAATPACFEEFVADSDTAPGLSFTNCQIGAQAALAQWKEGHRVYRSDEYAIDRYKCVAGHYTPRSAA